MGRPPSRYQRTANGITSGGTRKPETPTDLPRTGPDEHDASAQPHHDPDGIRQRNGARPNASVGRGEGAGATSSLRLSARCTSRLRCLAPWVAASGVAVLGAAALEAAGLTGFERFIGPLPGPLTVASAGAAGLGALTFLETRGFWRCSTSSTTLRGIVVAGAATVPLAAVAIGVDAAIGFPSDTNVAWPEAWLLYPVIAVVAEAAFHLLPLSGLVWLTRSRFDDLRVTGRTWVLILTAATVEPVAQVVLRSALLPFVVPHVFLIGVGELLLLRRFGYVPMVAFRVFYYLAWHVLWGQARLGLLS